MSEIETVLKDSVEQSGKSKFKKIVSTILKNKENGIAIPLIVVVLIIWLINPVFLHFDNIVNILRQSAYVFLIGITMTYVFIGGGMDLSVGSILALSGIISGLGLLAGIPIWICILLGIAIGAFTGLLSGIFVVKFKIPSFIVTLGMMYVARGVVQFLTRGNPVYPLPEYFNYLGQGYLFGIPIVVIVATVLGIIGHIILDKTIFGRSVFAVGGNPETARVSGINVFRISLMTYVLNGSAAGIAGIFTAARLGSALSNAGMGMELQVIAAVIIGGTSMFGGSGSIIGTMIGAIFMSVIANGMVILKISVALQSVVIGAIIILFVGLDQYNRKRQGMV
jgi:ribose/xylose/arabinose/galactoside ABC-type transport system permease subunit